MGLITIEGGGRVTVIRAEQICYVTLYSRKKDVGLNDPRIWVIEIGACGKQIELRFGQDEATARRAYGLILERMERGANLRITFRGTRASVEFE